MEAGKVKSEVNVPRSDVPVREVLATAEPVVQKSVATAQVAPAVEPKPQKEELSKPQENSFDLTAEQAEEVAKRAEAAFNRTAVRFNVRVDNGKGAPGLRFEVVDKETGKVVRKFPPNEMLDFVSKSIDDVLPKGALIDSKV